MTLVDLDPFCACVSVIGVREIFYLGAAVNHLPKKFSQAKCPKFLQKI